MQIVAFFYNFFVWDNLSQKWGYEKLGRTKILFLLLSTRSTKTPSFSLCKRCWNTHPQAIVTYNFMTDHEFKSINFISKFISKHLFLSMPKFYRNPWDIRASSKMQKSFFFQIKKKFKSILRKLLSKTCFLLITCWQ